MGQIRSPQAGIGATDCYVRQPLGSKRLARKVRQFLQPLNCYDLFGQHGQHRSEIARTRAQMQYPGIRAEMTYLKNLRDRFFRRNSPAGYPMLPITEHKRPAVNTGQCMCVTLNPILALQISPLVTGPYVCS